MLPLFKNKFLFVLFIGLLISSQASAQLLLTAPPRENAKQGEALYGPLAAYLTNLLGEEVVYQHPRDWLRYQRDIRRDKFDIVFDGPHFASWRVLHLNHIPVAKLPGKLDFYFIAHKTDDHITEPKSLILKKVCAIPPPNLTSLVLLNVLNSPIREPLIKSVKGGMKAVFAQLKNRECVAAVVRQDYFNKRLSPDERALYKIIYTSPSMPNQVVTVSSRLKKTQVEKITNVLMRPEAIDEVKPILKRFGGKKVKGFETAHKKDFIGQNELLEGVILGW